MKIKVLSLSLVLIALPVFAHHGGNSLYDVKKEVTADATVTSFQWTNPHVEIGLDVKDNSGRVSHLILETSSPERLSSRNCRGNRSTCSKTSVRTRARRGSR